MTAKEYLIQPFGMVNYPHLDKPLLYTQEALLRLSNTPNLIVRNEHNGNVLTESTNVYLKDDGLYATFKDELDTQKKGFSIVLNPKKLLDFEEHYELSGNEEFKGIDLTSNPRFEDTFLFNSNTTIESANKGEKMGDNDLKIIIDEKNREIERLKNEVNTMVTDKNTLSGDLQTKKDDLATAEANKQAVEDKLQKYVEAEKTEAEKIAKQLATINAEKEEFDEELLSVYNDMPIEKLRTLKTKQDEFDKQLAGKTANDTGFKGTPAGSVNDDNKHGDEDNNVKFSFKELSKANNIRV